MICCPGRPTRESLANGASCPGALKKSNDSSVGRCAASSISPSSTASRLKLDCDVLQADGGTRTASISGGYVAAKLAVHEAMKEGTLGQSPFLDAVAAVSVGVVDGQAKLDLCYEEDSSASVDLNVVQDDQGRFLEVQGTAEGAPFDRDQLDSLLDLATRGNEQILVVQRKALETAGCTG